MNADNPAPEGFDNLPGHPGQAVPPGDLGPTESGYAGQGKPASRASSTPAVEPRSYDFRTRARIPNDRLRPLEAQYARIARSLEAWLSGRIRGGVELTLQGIEQISFGEFVSSLTTPCCSYLYEIHDSGGQSAVVDFGQEFAFCLVERLFGGVGELDLPSRALTPIERMAVRSVADRVASLVRESWQGNIEIDMELSGWESIPESVQVAAPEDPVLLAAFQVAASEVTSHLTICLPFGVLETFFADGGGKRSSPVVGSERERLTTRESAEALLLSTRIDVAARLPDFRLPMADVAKLKPGAVISTGISTGARIEVTVSGQPRFLASPGRSGRKLAVRVLETLPTGEVENIPGVPPARTGKARVTSLNIPVKS